MRSYANRRRVFLLGLICCIVIIVWIAGLLWGSPGVKVTIANRSEAGVRDVCLRVTGECVATPRIEPGDFFATTINPTGESVVELGLVDASGSDRTEVLGIYLEQDYRGRIEIEVRPDGTVWYLEKDVGPPPRYISRLFGYGTSATWQASQSTKR